MIVMLTKRQGTIDHRGSSTSFNYTLLRQRGGAGVNRKVSEGKTYEQQTKLFAYFYLSLSISLYPSLSLSLLIKIFIYLYFSTFLSSSRPASLSPPSINIIPKGREMGTPLDLSVLP